MKRATIVLLAAAAGLLTACTTDPNAVAADDPSTSPTVTETVEVPVSETAPEEEPVEDLPAEDGNPLHCDAVHVEAAIAPGEANQDYWNTDIVLTNLGPDVCRLDGASGLEFFTGGDGRPLGINQVISEEGAGDLAIIGVGEQASMGVGYPTAAPGTRTDCLEGGSFAHVMLSGDDDVVEAWHPDRQQGLPPVCGAVTVTSWLAGGVPS